MSVSKTAFEASVEETEAECSAVADAEVRAAVLEEQVALHRDQVQSLQHRLNDLEVRHVLLGQAAEMAGCVIHVEPLQLLPDHLHVLPGHVRDLVGAGVRRGAIDALAAIDLHANDRGIGRQPMGWPRSFTPPERRTHALYFNRHGEAIAAETDIDELIRRGHNAGHDGM